MPINFEFYLTLATVLSGLMLLIHRFLPVKGWFMNLVATLGSLFGVLLLVLLIRSFVAEPFRIPSGSMLPTLEVGDFILVNKFAYGLRVPVLRNKFLGVGEPQYGDVIVFKYPSNPNQDFIKRVVGLPGDTIQYENKVVYVNGVRAQQRIMDREVSSASPHTMMRIEETLPGKKHEIYIYPESYPRDGEWKVPLGYYFMMGDNRDNSNDSRVWGFVAEEYLIGRAFFIWMHWNWDNGGIDFSRVGKGIG